MTIEEAFNAVHAIRYVYREDFEAGYRAGAEAMRERAANACDDMEEMRVNLPRVIRALPIDDKP